MQHQHLVFPGGTEVKKPAGGSKDVGSIPGSGRSPEEGNGNPLQCCCCCHWVNSVMSDSLWPWTAAHQASLSFTISQSLPKLTCTELVMPLNHLILCRALLLLFSILPNIRVFSNKSVLHIRWPKYWSFSFIISPSNECSGLISFRIDWFDLLEVQWTLKSLLQHFNGISSSVFSPIYDPTPTSLHECWKNCSFD